MNRESRRGRTNCLAECRTKSPCPDRTDRRHSPVRDGLRQGSNSIPRTTCQASMRRMHAAAITITPWQSCSGSPAIQPVRLTCAPTWHFGQTRFRRRPSPLRSAQHLSSIWSRPDRPRSIDRARPRLHPYTRPERHRRKPGFCSSAQGSRMQDASPRQVQVFSPRSGWRRGPLRNAWESRSVQ